MINESSIDYPRPSLPEVIWEKVDGQFKMRPEVKDAIYALLNSIPTGKRRVRCKAVHLIGSLCTNQYVDEADADIHIQPVGDEFNTEEEQKRVMKWMTENRDSIENGYIGSHPVEVFIQLNPDQDLMSDGCYDIINDKWLKGPKIVDLDYDPYEDFSDILPEVEEIAADMDIKLGELKRGVIDFQTIEAAIEQLPKDQQKKLYDKLEDKRNELEEDVEKLYKLRKGYIDARHKSSNSFSVEQAKKDVETSRKWRDANALHKYMHRYKYTKLVGDIAKFIKDDGELSDKEIDMIQGMIV